MERFDYGKRFILKTIIRNDRLDTYDKYIKYALSKGYEVERWKECTIIGNPQKNIWH